MKVVKENGLETLRDASKNRNDRKVLILEGQISVNKHDSCQKSYTNEKMIAAYLKKAAQPSTSLDKLRSSSDFYFKTDYFVCRTRIPED